MLEKVREYAMIKFAGDEQAVEQFVEGFEKSAGIGDLLGKKIGGRDHQDTIGTSVVKGMSDAFGKGLGGLGIALGATAVGTAYGAVTHGNLHGKFLQALERAVNSNPILKQAKRDKVLGYAETIFKFAPNVSTDSNLLSSILANAIHGEGIYPDTIKLIGDLEANYKKNTVFSPKSFV